MPFPAATPQRNSTPARASPPAEPLRRDQRATVHSRNRGGGHPCGFPSQPRKRNSRLWLYLLLLGSVCGTYYYTQTTSGKSVSLQEPTVPQPGREKKEAAKPEKKAVLPAVKAETSPEQKNAAPASPSGDAEQLGKTSPSISSGERNGDAPDIFKG
mgnify:CR=1 FL=1